MDKQNKQSMFQMVNEKKEQTPTIEMEFHNEVTDFSRENVTKPYSLKSETSLVEEDDSISPINFRDVLTDYSLEWLAEIELTPSGFYWIHLPTKNNATIRLLLHNKDVIFGPNLMGQLVLDSEFKTTYPMIAKKMRALVRSCDEDDEFRCIISAKEICSEHYIKTQLASLIYNIIDRSASLYGTLGKPLMIKQSTGLDTSNTINISISSVMHSIPNKHIIPDLLYPKDATYYVFESANVIKLNHLIQYRHLSSGKLLRATQLANFYKSMQIISLWLLIENEEGWGVAWIEEQHIIVFDFPSNRVRSIIQFYESL